MARKFRGELRQPMNVDVRTESIIGAPVGRVAAFASEPDNAPRWYLNIKSVEWQTPRAIEVGSRFAFVARFLRRHLEYGIRSSSTYPTSAS